MKNILVFCFLFLGLTLRAQSANQLLLNTYNKFAQVKNFSGKVHIDFDLPSINMDKMDGKVYFKAPKKFRVKLSGIAFLPKQDPFYVHRMLKDSSTYTAVFSGAETIKGAACKIVTVIPNNDPELVMAKLWIDAKSQIVLKSEITTKSSGTGKAEYTYGNHVNYALPDQIFFTVDMATFKIPKMVAVDINSKKKTKENANKGTGTINFFFSEYVINKGVDDKVFTDK
jgi:outer membrane lipoprotein-sorting protein